MLRLLLLTGFFHLTTLGFPQQVKIKNNTGETINVISCLAKGSSVKDFDSLIARNQLTKPLTDGETVTLNVNQSAVNIHFFTSMDLLEANCYFIPAWGGHKKLLVLNNSHLESRFGGVEIVALNDEDRPRVLVKVKNETGAPLYFVYYKSTSAEKYLDSIITSWGPIKAGETRSIFFFPTLKKVKNAAGDNTYEGFLDFKIIGFSEDGKPKTYIINNFDCVNQEDIVIK